MENCFKRGTREHKNIYQDNLILMCNGFYFKTISLITFRVPRVRRS